MGGDGGASQNKEGGGIGWPEEQNGRGRGPGLCVVDVSERIVFEDVGLGDRNVDVTEDGEAHGKGGPERTRSRHRDGSWRGMSPVIRKRSPLIPVA